MEIGICAGVEAAHLAAEAGADYFEWSVGAYLKPLNDTQSFTSVLSRVKNSPIPCPAVNVFIPGDLKITGPEVNFLALENYASVAFSRAREAGVKVIVFGSGGARRVPDGFERAKAEAQLVKFGKMLGRYAEGEGVTVAVEPLNRSECNILNTLDETAEYVRKVDLPAFRLLVDAYHWAKENEPEEIIVKNGDLLVHAHIATKANRLPPGGEEHDFTMFFKALKDANYSGRLSIEARLPDLAERSLFLEQVNSAVRLIRKSITN